MKTRRNEREGDGETTEFSFHIVSVFNYPLGRIAAVIIAANAGANLGRIFSSKFLDAGNQLLTQPACNWTAYQRRCHVKVLPSSEGC